MSDTSAIRVTGLREFRRELRALDRSLPKAVRLALNEAAKLIVDETKPDVPTLTGRAQASVRARSTQTRGRVVGGSARVPYYGWLEFGGRVGRNRSVARPRKPGGRYMHPAFARKRDEVRDKAVEALAQVAQAAGLEVRGG